MKCPFCKKENDRVIDSRTANEGYAVRRRRQCESCGRRYTTYEKIEEVPVLVVKKDNHREPYDRNKVLSGLIKACEKRPVSAETQENIVQQLEAMIDSKYEREVPSTEIGEFLMQKLYDTDQVAYVRFASVYRQFKDINHFMKELRTLLTK